MHAKVILVVDDEPVVRRLIHFCLKRRGYIILEAESGSAAIKTCLAYKGKIDLALVDVIMPGLHGPQLQRMLNKLDPEMKILYMSGFPHVEAINRGMDDFVSKPFTLENLYGKIDLALSEEPPEAPKEKKDKATVLGFPDQSLAPC